MHTKIRKFWLYALTLITFISIATAQDIGDEPDGLLPLFADLLGVGGMSLGSDPYNTIGFFAAIAVMVISIYFVLETAVRRLDNDQLREATGLGRREDGLSTRLLGFSTLLVLSGMGTAAQFYNIVWGIQGLVQLALGVGIFGGILYVIAGGLIFGGGALKTGAVGVKAGAEGAKDMEEGISQAKELLSRGEKEEQVAATEAQEAADEGNDEELRESFQILLKAAEDIGEAEEDIERIEEMGWQEIRDLKNTAKHAIQEEGQEIELLAHIEEDFDKFETQLTDIGEIIRDETRDSILPWDGGGTTGAKQLFETDPLINYPERFVEELERIIKGEKIEEENVNQEVKEALQLARAWKKVQQLEEELPEAIKAAAKEDQFIERIAENLGDPELVKLAEQEEESIGNLQKHLSNIMDREDKCERELVELEKLVEKEIRDEEKIIELLEELETRIENIILPTIDELKQNIGYLYGDGIRMEHNGKEMHPSVYLQNLEDTLQQFRKTFEQIEEKTAEEDKMLRRLGESLRNVI